VTDAREARAAPGNGSNDSWLPGGFTATRSIDGTLDYIHVLRPPVGRSVQLPFPVDGRSFTAATLLVNGKTAALTPNAFGYLLTLPADENWDARDTVFRLTASLPLPVSITLEPVADCRILNLTTATQGGTDTYLGVFQGRDRTLLRFDLSGIPAGSSLFSSTLTLRASSSYNANPNANPVQVFRATKPWTELGALWAKYDATTNWTNPGGDAVGTTGAQLVSPYAVNTSDPAANGDMSWDIGTLVQEWVSGVNPNQGMLITLGGNQTSDLHFWSREYATSSLRPTLTVIYTPPLTAGPATAPAPAVASTGVSRTTMLGWTAGANATTHRVYFGTSSTAVTSATTASPEYKGEQVGLTYSPGTLSTLTTHYWRVDEVVGGLVTPGPVWSFTTIAPYDQWVLDQGLTPGVNSAPDADPDADGIPNLLEFVLGGQPRQSDSSTRPTAIVTGGNLVFTFARADASEIGNTLLVQYGTDLATWTDVPVGAGNSVAGAVNVTVAENASAPDTITVTIPQGAATRIFARLKASRP
jgi:hypothetical protein